MRLWMTSNDWLHLWLQSMGFPSGSDVMHPGDITYRLEIRNLLLLPQAILHESTGHTQLPCGKKGPTAVDIKYLPDKFLQPQKSKSGVISFTTEELVQADARGKESLREISVMSDTIIRQVRIMN